MTSPLAPQGYPAFSSRPYTAPSEDQAQRAALYIEGIGWSTPAAVSPRIAPMGSGSGPGAVGSSPLARQSSIMPDWSVAEEANQNQVLASDLLILIYLLILPLEVTVLNIPVQHPAWDGEVKCWCSVKSVKEQCKRCCTAF